MSNQELAIKIARQYNFGDKNPHKHTKASPSKKWALFTLDKQDMSRALTDADFSDKFALLEAISKAEAKANAAYRNDEFNSSEARRELALLQATK